MDGSGGKRPRIATCFCYANEEEENGDDEEEEQPLTDVSVLQLYFLPQVPYNYYPLIIIRDVNYRKQVNKAVCSF